MELHKSVSSTWQIPPLITLVCVIRGSLEICSAQAQGTYTLKATPKTAARGYCDAKAAPVLGVKPELGGPYPARRAILLTAWQERTQVSSIRPQIGWPKSLSSSCPPCRSKRPKPYVRKSGAWQLSLPAAEVAEKLHGLGETRVLVVYPELPQNPHKLPLVVTPQDLFQLTQQRDLFFERESVFLGHTRADSNRLLRPLLAVDVYTQLVIQEAA